jgi:hypothetical protein
MAVVTCRCASRGRALIAPRQPDSRRHGVTGASCGGAIATAHHMAGSSSDDDDTGRESRSKLLKRHKAEVLKAQKEGQRLGKKRQEEAAALLAQVTARHIAELAAFDATGAEATQQAREPAAAVAAVAATLAATSLPSDTTEAADAAGAAGKVCASPSTRLVPGSMVLWASGVDRAPTPA